MTADALPGVVANCAAIGARRGSAARSAAALANAATESRATARSSGRRILVRSDRSDVVNPATPAYFTISPARVRTQRRAASLAAPGPAVLPFGVPRTIFGMNTVPPLRAAIRIAMVALLLLSAAAHAEGLGTLTVHSALGERLQAEAAVVTPRSGQRGGLHGSIATADTYREMGVAFDAVLYSVHVSVETRAAGPVLRLTSTRPIREPVLELLLVLDSEGGRAMRRYTVLLDAR
jgi:hypothetical protein